MELRGIGIINIKHLFGVSAVRASKSVELVIELERWDPAKKYDRLGLDGETLRDPGARASRCCGCPSRRAATSRS